VARHKCYGLLHPLELVFSLWSSMTLDFIMDLPLSDGCDQLWVIIDLLTNGAFYPASQEREKRGESRAGIWVGNMDITWDTYQRSFAPGLVIYIEVLEGIPNGH
jgi:hypothetical protein